MATGSCVCGKATYTLKGQPLARSAQAICHCHDCRRLTGSAFTYSLQVRKEDFALFDNSGSTDSATPLLRETKFTHISGVTMKFSACGDCGTRLYKQVESPEHEPFLLVQAGTIIDRGGDKDGQGVQVKPDMELWTKHRASWIPAIDGVVQKQEF
ncbi:Mss4-like protein [Microdochium trichocladiopsis]|uniref:Mss4-like protein n=1 Tax=Microdochium trichocladiopsis TaxID=1682393 RepID=A0A9P8Y7F0_9PEZI|nr:Mss4-like protein [Microdochium trichocladiopsis]KAH7031706.1 Mss4-like protein [Microdochium trichocladiopsis]